jgi:hypothetical protein
MAWLLKLVRKEEGWGVKAPALFARLKRTRGVGRASRGYLFASAGVAVTLVAVVSFLTWLSPASDKPNPLKVVDHFLPGVIQKVDSQASTLLEVNKDPVLANVPTVLVLLR